MSDNDEKKQEFVLPKYHDESFDNLFEKLQLYTSPDKQREMRKKTTKEVNNVRSDLDSILGSKDYTKESVEDRKKAAAKAVYSLAKDWYKSHLNIDVDNLTEDHVNLYLKEAGVFDDHGSYDNLLKHITNNEASLDFFDENNKYIQQLAKHNAEARDEDGKDFQVIQRTLTDKKHYDSLKSKVEKELDKPFDKTASAINLMNEYQTHAIKKDPGAKKTYES